jgi:hypothetical protein
MARSFFLRWWNTGCAVKEAEKKKNASSVSRIKAACCLLSEPSIPACSRRVLLYLSWAR